MKITAQGHEKTHFCGQYAHRGRVLIMCIYNRKDMSDDKLKDLAIKFEEEEQLNIVNNEALFFAIAGSELIMSIILGYWTQQIRKEKVYL